MKLIVFVLKKMQGNLILRKQTLGNGFSQEIK